MKAAETARVRQIKGKTVTNVHSLYFSAFLPFASNKFWFSPNFTCAQVGRSVYLHCLLQRCFQPRKQYSHSTICEQHPLMTRSSHLRFLAQTRNGTLCFCELISRWQLWKSYSQSYSTSMGMAYSFAQESCLSNYTRSSSISYCYFLSRI